MIIRYVKASNENVERINNLVEKGFRLYGAQKGFVREPIMLIFQKEEDEEDE